MKKFLLLYAAACCSLSLIFWNPAAHRAIAQIAENNLTLKAKNRLKELFNNQSLVDISTWADEVVNDDRYTNTTLWHFVNCAQGIVDKDKFGSFYYHQTNPNIGKELYRLYNDLCMDVLAQPKKTAEQKRINIKFLVSLLADVHQPMNTGRYQDNCGKDIVVRFYGKKTTLYKLWNNDLLEHQHLSYQQVVKLCDTAGPKQIHDWQKGTSKNADFFDPFHVEDWLYESYLLSSNIYEHIEPNADLEDAYFNENIKVINQRIAMAGIRLASLLNEVFAREGEVGVSTYDTRYPFGARTFTAVAINEAVNHMGAAVKVCDKVFNIYKTPDSTLVYLGAPYPNQLLTLILKDEAATIADSIMNKHICLSGDLVNYRSKPEIFGNRLFQKGEPLIITGSSEARPEIKIEIDP